jgi:hypothetical protein
MDGSPVRSEEGANSDYDELVYPIALDRSSELVRTLFLPFINIAVMKLTASEGLGALGKLLGLPRSYGIPKSWESGKAGLVHRPEKPSTIAEFAVLHEVMIRQELASTPGSQGSLSQKDVAEPGHELARLEDFFRDFDPVRTFADLHRVSDGKDGSPAIWTTEAEVNRIQSELELASAEYRLRELKKEWAKRQKMQEEIQHLSSEVERLQGKSPRRAGSSVAGGSRPTITFSTSTSAVKANSQNGVRLAGSYDSNDRAVIVDPERASEQRTKRKKMRIRPYLGSC